VAPAAAPVILGGGGDLLQHRGGQGKVRRSPRERKRWRGRSSPRERENDDGNSVFGGADGSLAAGVDRRSLA
jgi:hypothetical protein